MKSIFIRYTFELYALLSSNGCFFSGATSEKETDAYVAEEHLNHEVPDHMPADFPDAVQEIRKRRTHLLEDLSAGELKHLERELPELLDIIGWIPKLAADSDLNKQEWEQVRDDARELERIYQPLTGSTQLEGWETDEAIRERIEQIMSDFDRLVEKYPSGFEKMIGGHDHHEEHHNH